MEGIYRIQISGTIMKTEAEARFMAEIDQAVNEKFKKGEA